MNDFKEVILSNGLKLILVPREGTATLTTMIMFGVGSKNESSDIAGISHVLEHMAFKGTKKRPTGLAISEFIDSIGGDYNAFTSKEYTGYFVKSTPAHLTDSFDFLSDILLNALYDEDELEKEKSVIVEEIKMYEDLPMAVVESKFEESLFGDNAFGREIIGFRDTVLATTAKKLIDYKEKFYHAENAVLVLAGNFKPYSENEIKELAVKYFDLPSGETVPAPKIKLASGQAVAMAQKPIEQSHIIIGYRTVPLTHPDHFTLAMAALILGGSASSRMFEQVRERRGLAYTIKTYESHYAESGAIITQAGVPDEKLIEAIEAIRAEYQKLKVEKVPEKEIQKVREMIKGKLLIKYEDPEELAYHYATAATIEDKILTIDDVIAKFSNITADDIMRVANKYFVSENLGLSYVGKARIEGKIKELLK